jgi:hypothetical protein
MDFHEYVTNCASWIRSTPTHHYNYETQCDDWIRMAQSRVQWKGLTTPRNYWHSRGKILLMRFLIYFFFFCVVL